MKKNTTPAFFLIFSLFLFHCISLKAQRVTYAYDSAGNRISRIIEFNSPRQLNQSESEEPEFFSDEINQHQIKIYPNPTKGNLGIDVGKIESEEQATIEIYNMQGSLIEKKQVSEAFTQLNINHYAPAQYLLKITIDRHSTTWKIIKE